MTKTSKFFLVFGIFVFIGMLFVIGSILFILFVYVPMSINKSIELDKKRSGEASGKIVSVSQFRSSGDQYTAPSINSTYDYRYEVNGVTYNLEQVKDGKDGYYEKQGLKVKVCYDPAEPKSSNFYFLEDNKICGK